MLWKQCCSYGLPVCYDCICFQSPTPSYLCYWLVVNLPEMPWHALLQCCQLMHRDSKYTCFCEVYWLSHPFLTLPFGGYHGILVRWVLPVPVDESMSVGETMSSCRCFYNLGSCSSLIIVDNHKSRARSCLERFAVGLKRSSASLCFWCSKVWDGRKMAKCRCMVSFQEVQCCHV